MARIRALSRDEAAPEVRPFFDQNLETYGLVLTPIGVMAHRPSIQLGVRALADGLVASGLIPARLRHLINIRIANRIGCPF